MCLQCVCGANSWGSVLPGFALMQATRGRPGEWTAGAYGLVISNDPSFVFSTKPRPSPMWPEYRLNNDEGFAAEVEAWEDEVQAFTRELLASAVPVWRAEEVGSLADEFVPPALSDFWRLRDALVTAGLLAQENEFNEYTVFSTLFHYLGRVLEDAPYATHATHDEDGFAWDSVEEQASKLLGLGQAYIDAHRCWETSDGGTVTLCFGSTDKPYVIGRYFIRRTDGNPLDADADYTTTYDLSLDQGGTPLPAREIAWYLIAQCGLPMRI